MVKMKKEKNSDLCKEAYLNEQDDLHRENQRRLRVSFAQNEER